MDEEDAVDLEYQLKSLLKVISDHQYLEADKIYQNILRHIETLTECNDYSSNSDAKVKDKKKVRHLIEVVYATEINLFLERRNAIKTLSADLSINNHSHSEWSLGAQLLGITSYFKKSKHNERNIRVKVETVLDDLPLFEQCAIFHEVSEFVNTFFNI